MSQTINIVDANGSRSVIPDKLPLTIGSAAGADIRVAGPVTDSAYALIDQLDARPFIQPAGELPVARAAVAVNGEAITATRWLESGDVITVAGTSVTCDFTADTLQFVVSGETLEYDTLPPVFDGPDGPSGTDSMPIEPVRRTASAAAPRRVEDKRRVWAFGYGALALLALTAIYLFTAKAVKIEVDPADARIQIAGSLLKPQFGGRYLLWPGDYRVMLSAEGYEPSRQEITVDGDAANQDFSFVLRKLPGRLEIRIPQGVEARFSIDGGDTEAITGDAISLEPGTHAIRIDAERYLVFEGSVEIEGRDQLQSFEADLIPGWADVTVTSNPPGASVYVDDEEIAETPATVQLIAGARELTVRKEGFKIWRKTIAAVANEPRTLPEIELAEADGQLTVTSVPGAAAVTIDGRYRGTTPVDAELTPGGAHEVIISKPGFATVTRSITMESRRGKTLRVELEARVGIVTIVTDPPDADLFIDGVPRGGAGQTLSLPARPHRIEIRKAGFEPYSAEITPKPGLPDTLKVKLLTPEQAVLAATPRIITSSQGIDLLRVGPGELEMGAPRREQGRRANEVQRKVRLTRPFYIGTHEITNKQFREFDPKHTSGAQKYRQLADGDHPVVMLSWEAATGFCNWLSHQESLPNAYVWEDGEIVLASPPNLGYRLPTEAEWEWAARYNGGGGKQKYPWGNQMPPARKSGNYADLSARSILANVISDYTDGFPITAPAGRFAPSPIGLFDIGGNVAEWVNDNYGVPSISTTTDVEVDPVGPAEGQYHVIRGSGWRHASIGELRLAYRDFGSRGRLDVGFRIARYADEPK
jgi:formylglycine-generating enzyme required for sulfatase activity/sulfur carrier protein ThiS